MAYTHDSSALHRRSLPNTRATGGHTGAIRPFAALTYSRPAYEEGLAMPLNFGGAVGH